MVKNFKSNSWQKGFLKLTKRTLITFLIVSTLFVGTGLAYLFGPWSKSAEAAWSAQHLAWGKRKQLTLTNNSGSTINSSVPYQINIDTKSLYYGTRGDLLPTCNDLRIVYQVSGSSAGTELARAIQYASGAVNCTDSSSTIITFPLQASITNGSSDTNYYLYYANPSAVAPALSQISAYNINGKTATFAAPFNGSTTALAVGSGTPTTATGAIRYSGGKSALSFNGLGVSGGNKVTTTAASSINDLPNSDFTVEGWFYDIPDTVNSIHYLATKLNNLNTVGWFFYTDASTRRLIFRIKFGGTEMNYTTSTTYTQSTWNHFAAVFTASTKTAKIFINGQEASYGTSTAGSGSYSTDASNDLLLAEAANNSNHFLGYMDEVRVSNNARFSSAFTPQTSPLIRDNKTAVLYHFDENGDDPRNSGKTIDDSGNANHGTISGAKYVGGLPGVDRATFSPIETGNSSTNSYAGHQGVFIEEGQTNLITNPSFENSTFSTGWGQAAANLTVTQNTTSPFYKFGASSAKIVASSTDDYYISATSGSTTKVAYSAYVYDGTSGNVGGTVSSSIATLYFAGASQTTTYTNMGGGWWRLTYACASSCTSTAANYGVHVLSGKTIYLDGIQLEATGSTAGGTYSTSYLDGSLGSNYAWTGETNNSTSTRTNTQLSYSATSNISTTAGSFSAWVWYPSNITSCIRNAGIISTRANSASGGSTHGIYMGLNCGFTTLMVDGGGLVNVSASGVYNQGNWKYIVGTWDTGPNELKLYLNGAQIGSTGTITATPSTDGSLYLGKDLGGSSSGADVAISDLRIYSSVLTSTDVADLYNLGLASHSESAVSERSKPVLDWKFDELQGTSAKDSSLQKNDGTLSNIATTPTGISGYQTADKCISSACLAFDGSNDFVSKSYFLDNELDLGTGDMTISGWFRHSSTISGTDTLVSRVDGASVNGVGYKVYMNSSGFLCFGIDDTAGSFPSDSACGTTSRADSRWHHFAAYKNGTTDITLFVDGLQVGQDTSIASGSISGSSPTFYVGIDGDGSSNPWDGSIDEVQVYSEKLTTAQILADFNAKSDRAPVGAVLGVANASGGSLAQGLTGYWKLDESSGNASDFSGNANTLTNGNTTTYVAGKYGNAANFVAASSQSLTVTDASQAGLDAMTSQTISAWVNPASTNSGPIMAKESTNGNYSYSLNMNNANIIYNNSNSGSYSCGNVTSTGSLVPNNTWTHVTVTFDGPTRTVQIYINGVLNISSTYSNTSCTSIANTSSDFFLGGGTQNGAATYYNGKIDEARVYRRALSAVEVGQLANFGPGPVGYWKFDDNNGTTSIDSSGNGNNGTLTNISSPATSTSGWNPGKYGGAIAFDGTNDYVDVGTGSSIDNSGGQVSVGAWIYPQSFSNYQIIYGEGNSDTPFTFSTGNGGQKVNFTGGGVTNCGDGGSNLLVLNTWQYVAITFNAGTVNTYYNGTKQVTCTGGSSTLTSGATSLKIGARAAAQRFNGRIDEVKQYNYARSSAQVIEDMNGGHPAPGSPVGTPLGYWRFDEGYGTSAANVGSQGSTLNGTLTNMASPATSTSGWSQNGKFGKALNFDGSNDYVAMPSDVSALKITGAVTLSAWIKLANISSAHDIISKYTGTGATSSYSLNVNTSGKLLFEWSDGTAHSLTGNTTLATGTWYHVVGIFNPSTAVQIYVNGVLDNSNTTSIASALQDSTTILDIGARNVGNKIFSGSIDEPKVYAQALTADQVKIDMNKGQAQQLGALGNNSSYDKNAANQEYCLPGDATSCAAPVGRWDFNEGSGTATNDSSGNANTGTLTNGPTWGVGKNDKSVVFDGSDDYIDAGSGTSLDDLPSGDFTAEWWMYLTNTVQPAAINYINKSNGGVGTTGWNMLGTPNGTTLRFQVMYNTTSMDYITTAAYSLFNKWSHVTMVFASSTKTAKIYVNGVEASYSTSTAGSGTYQSDASRNLVMGRQNDVSVNNFSGKLDNVRIFNYARTPAQIALDYNRGGPVAYWRLDDCQGTSLIDSSGNSNVGTLSIGGSGTQTAAGDCNTVNSATAWYNGRTGKRNYSLNFDGTDDKITVSAFSPLAIAGQTTTKISWGGWFYPTTSATSKTLLEKATEFQLTTNASSQPLCGIYYSGAFHNSSAPTPALTLNTWNQVVCTYDGTNINTYLNGLLVKQSSETNSVTAASSILYMAQTSGGANFYSGQIDDVRIHNYPLTLTQVQQLYNNGAVNFGPGTGSP